MREIEINLPEVADEHAAIRKIDRCIAGSGLTVASKGTLKSYPGCTHWHLRRAKQKGTLELTLWPSQCRAWFKVQAGREADWIDGEMRKLKKCLEALP